MVNVTKHAYKRMKERCGYSKSTCQRMAEKAFAEGVSHADVSGRLDKYFYQLYCYDYSANNLRIYGEFLRLRKNRSTGKRNGSLRMTQWDIMGWELFFMM